MLKISRVKSVNRFAIDVKSHIHGKFIKVITGCPSSNVVILKKISVTFLRRSNHDAAEQLLITWLSQGVMITIGTNG